MAESVHARHARHLLHSAWELLPPRLRARLEYASGLQRFFDPFGGPLNGQHGRQQMVREIIERCQIERIVETGSYRGNSTQWFAAFGLPVTTVEVSPLLAEFCRLRLRRFANIKLIEGSSVDALQDMSPTAGAPTFFYLDSHWHEHLPLRQELQIVLTRFPDAVVMIDDFQVADDPGYGFDDYGTGKRLDLDYVLAAELPPLSLYYPRLAAGNESGHRRGSLTLTASLQLASCLDRVTGLRRVSLPA